MKASEEILEFVKKRLDHQLEHYRESIPLFLDDPLLHGFSDGSIHALSLLIDFIEQQEPEEGK